MNAPSLGWPGIIRLGLVQSAIGAMVVLTTSTLNRVMVVEYALPASLPAALVAWHYAVQLTRPRWGHGSDKGHARTPWIIVGMGLLALGALLAANAAVLIPSAPFLGTALAIVAFTLIGAGVAAAGTSLLALLATAVAPERRPAAAASTWIMMITGIVITAGVSGQLLDPFSPQRLVLVASGVAGIAFLVTLAAVAGVEKPAVAREADAPSLAFRDALAATWADPLARNFTIFVFVSMLAYSAQDLILEPYAGLVFGYTLGQSTALSGVQHGGVLLGMIVVGLLGSVVPGDRARRMKRTTVLGCALSAAALILLAAGGYAGPGWPLQTTVFTLGFANGVFAVSAIALMMTYAGEGANRQQGLRMGVWGAAQAMAFGLGGFLGASGFDLMRGLIGSTPAAFMSVFAVEGLLFLVAAGLALSLGKTWTLTRPAARSVNYSFGAGA
jgi:BCD family chlorophyll transporter-like MFS transporter